MSIVLRLSPAKIISMIFTKVVDLDVARNVFLLLKEFSVPNLEVQRCQNSTFQWPDSLSFKIGDKLKLAFSLPPFHPFPQKIIFVIFICSITKVCQKCLKHCTQHTSYTVLQVQGWIFCNFYDEYSICTYLPTYHTVSLVEVHSSIGCRY